MEFFIYIDSITIISLILIFCSTGLRTRMLFNTQPNFIIVHRTVSEKMHLKHEKIKVTENTERREVKEEFNYDTRSYLIYFSFLRITSEEWNFKITIFKLCTTLWAKNIFLKNLPHSPLKEYNFLILLAFMTSFIIIAYYSPSVTSWCGGGA